MSAQLLIIHCKLSVISNLLFVSVQFKMVSMHSKKPIYALYLISRKFTHHRLLNSSIVCLTDDCRIFFASISASQWERRSWSEHSLLLKRQARLIGCNRLCEIYTNSHKLFSFSKSLSKYLPCSKQSYCVDIIHTTVLIMSVNIINGLLSSCSGSGCTRPGKHSS